MQLCVKKSDSPNFFLLPPITPPLSDILLLRSYRCCLNWQEINYFIRLLLTAPWPGPLVCLHPVETFQSPQPPSAINRPITVYQLTFVKAPQMQTIDTNNISPFLSPAVTVVGQICPEYPLLAVNKFPNLFSGNFCHEFEILFRNHANAYLPPPPYSFNYYSIRGFPSLFTQPSCESPQ